MLLFMDGQAHYDTAGLPLKYTTVESANTIWSVVAEGRFGNAIKRVSTTNFQGGYLAVSPLTTRLGPWTATTSGAIGFAIKIDDLSRLDPSSQLITVMEGPRLHAYVKIATDGTFALYSEGSLETLRAVSAEGLSSGAWHYVECKWVIFPTAGSFEIRVNTVPVLTYSGELIEGSLSPSLGVWNTVRILRLQSLTPPYLVARMCDLYLTDLAFADPDDVHDFLGDGVIDTIMPNGIGAATGWDA